ncbi:uncharacterized protein [Ptychodera flava]|uniref:uncharacterized protein isoform X1 n=1 Tax=Ptychodera flava TaxID=63121 RepID=UPI003969D317
MFEAQSQSAASAAQQSLAGEGAVSRKSKMAHRERESSSEDEVVKIGILTVSDRCSRGEAEDKSGPNLAKLVTNEKSLQNTTVTRAIVPDEVDKIQEKLIDWSDNHQFNLVLTTGGTGFAPRDVTPEATKAVIEKECPGMSCAMVMQSMKITPMAMLSRAVCGIRAKTLIVNLPGSTKGAQECFEIVLPALPHALHLLRDDTKKVRKTHTEVQQITDQQHTHHDHQYHRVVRTDARKKQRKSDNLSNLDSNHQNGFNSQETDTHSTEITNKEKRLTQKDKTSHQNKLPAQARDQQEIPSSADFERSTVSQVEDVRQHLNLIVPESQFIRVSITEADEHQDSAKNDENPNSSVVGEQREEQGYQKRSGNKQQGNETDVFDFDEPDNESGGKSKKQKKNKTASNHKGFKRISWKSCNDFTEVTVGTPLKDFLTSHPSLKDVTLHRGKRDIKRDLVIMERHNTAVDKGSWQRGQHVHERNRYDDHFVATANGEKRIEEMRNKKKHDMYVVAWYLWCPGHGNCRRACGGYGQCVKGCSGVVHKQDRHNCTLLVALKIFLGDLKTWRVKITGSHVPPDVSIAWQPPPKESFRLDQDVKDVILSCCDKQKYSSSKDIFSVLKDHPAAAEKLPLISRQRVSFFVSGVRKRRRDGCYNVKDRNNEQEKKKKCTDNNGCLALTDAASSTTSVEIIKRKPATTVHESEKQRDESTKNPTIGISSGSVAVETSNGQGKVKLSHKSSKPHV